MVIKNVLVATDFSPSSESALAYGRELARQFASRLHVIHVLSDSFTQVFTGEPSHTATEVGRRQATLGQRERRRLEAAITNEDRWRLGVTTVLPTGSVAYEIVTYARRAEIDVIVMGTHGRAGLAHTWLGSVAEKVVRTACCPVLTVPHAEPQRAVAEASDAAMAR